MIAFSPLRTKRLNVKLRELTIGETMQLCKMPPNMQEAGTSALLDFIVVDDEKSGMNAVTDHRLWTVQERAFVVGHYLAHISDKPDFSVGENSYSDYLSMEKQVVHDCIDIGTVASDHWYIRPLLGIHAETIERLIAEDRIEGGQSGWWIGAMAAMLTQDKSAALDLSKTEDEIEFKAKVFKDYPTTDFMELLSAFFDGVSKTNHLFSLTFLEDGIAWEVPGLPPARFQFTSAVDEAAWAVFGSHEGQSSRDDSVLQPADAGGVEYINV